MNPKYKPKIVKVPAKAYIRIFILKEFRTRENCVIASQADLSGVISGLKRSRYRVEMLEYRKSLDKMIHVQVPQNITAHNNVSKYDIIDMSIYFERIFDFKFKAHMEALIPLQGVNKSLRSFIERYGFDESEFGFETAKKKYQRMREKLQL